MTGIKPVQSDDALAHLEKRLQYETDCWGMNFELTKQDRDFVLVDVHSPDLCRSVHLPNATNIPRGKMMTGYMKSYATDKVL